MKRRSPLLAHCRTRGIWLVADDAYERLIYHVAEGLAHAPGVLGQIDPDERFISANTFSKAWAMTGWRLGWLIAPAAFVRDFAKLIEFNTSCAPPFVQRAGIAALAQGESFIGETLLRLRRARDLLVQRLSALPGVEAATPAGAMYQFFRIAGRSDDSLAFAKTLAGRFGLRLAPGIAFGAEGEGYLRWCFAASEAAIEEGVRRLAVALAARDGTD